MGSNNSGLKGLSVSHSQHKESGQSHRDMHLARVEVGDQFPAVASPFKRWPEVFQEVNTKAIDYQQLEKLAHCQQAETVSPKSYIPEKNQFTFRSSRFFACKSTTE